MSKDDVRCWLRAAFSWRSVVHNSIGAFFATLIVLIIALYGQRFETLISPVVAIEPYRPEDIYRDKDTGCFTMHLSKLTPASIVKYEFFAETRLSYFLPLAAYLADPKTHKRLADSDLVSHPQGSHWDRTYCYDMLSAINDGQCYRVTGHAEHARHPFWNSITPIREFVVPSNEAPASECLMTAR